MPFMNQPLTRQRVRITFGVHEALRYVGHLDMLKTWERVLRRAGLPLEYSQGFNPRPRMQFAAALLVGATSDNEHLDVWLTDRLDNGFPDAWIERLNDASPAGLRVLTIKDTPIRSPALPTLVTHAEYVLTPVRDEIDPDDLGARARHLLAQPTIERQGRKKPYDLRPLILDLSMNDAGQLIAQLVTGDQGNGRPDELLDALGLQLHQAHIHRRRLYLKDAE
jgi:radical SAM-linked protein